MNWKGEESFVLKTSSNASDSGDYNNFTLIHQQLFFQGKVSVDAAQAKRCSGRRAQSSEMAAERFPRSVCARWDLPPTWPVWEESPCLAQSEKDSTEMQPGERELIFLSSFGKHRCGDEDFSVLIWSNISSRLTSQLRASRTELRPVYKIALIQMTSKFWSRFFCCPQKKTQINQFLDWKL